MAESGLKDLVNWAKKVDHGICQLEHLVERNGMFDSDLDPKEVLVKLEDIIVNAKSMKALVQNDVEKLKSMSDELKTVIAMTEVEDVRKIDEELKEMLNTLFPNEAAGTSDEAAAVVEDPEPAGTIQADVQDGDMNVARAVAAALTPVKIADPEESFTEVEITPGLVNRIPNSRLGTENIISSSEMSLLRPTRKRTLIFSPGDNYSRTPSPRSEHTMPQVVLQDCSNWNRPRNGTIAEETVDSPEILEKPSRPVLASMRY